MNYRAYAEGIPSTPDIAGMQARHDQVAAALDSWDQSEQFTALMQSGNTKEADAMWKKQFPHL